MKNKQKHRMKLRIAMVGLIFWSFHFYHCGPGGLPSGLLRNKALPKGGVSI